MFFRSREGARGGQTWRHASNIFSVALGYGASEVSNLVLGEHRPSFRTSSVQNYYLKRDSTSPSTLT